MPEEMVTQQLQELNNKIQQLTESVRSLESRIGEQLKANVQTTEAMVKSLAANNPSAEGVLTGTLESLKKLL
jgi:prefoldin subunit 5